MPTGLQPFRCVGRTRRMGTEGRRPDRNRRAQRRKGRRLPFSHERPPVPAPHSPPRRRAASTDGVPDRRAPPPANRSRPVGQRIGFPGEISAPGLARRRDLRRASSFAPSAMIAAAACPSAQALASSPIALTVSSSASSRVTVIRLPQVGERRSSRNDASASGGKSATRAAMRKTSML